VVPDPVPPPRLRQPRLADMIAERFRSQILDGSLLPGGRLPRQEALAQELGVSLTVVREALRMLEAQGLVTVHRGKTGGATVRVPDGAAISSAISTVASLSRIAPGDIAATLTALDGLCAQSAAAQPGRAALARQLTGSLDAQLRHAGDEGTFRLECARFHAEISRRCGLGMLHSISDALETSARNLRPAVTRRCEGPGPGNDLTAERILADHNQATQAIAAGDGRAASVAAAHPPARRR
jgi:GntR family transcriptional regulator, transcriptional repressor for pyruvate dehydrogenase complex